ncbi:hypothetical protein PsorP6_001362 [Peronosclerospora sorghi]|uniref:Uncharacterized protein n=1 Tax=Peronosclerospora sorghi TaxID=230839 RepID=A0ACC0WUD3_9STRA|nr:hypothetical protein PsorP6_001362 [Peronosclerospora sorghi]
MVPPDAIGDREVLQKVRYWRRWARDFCLHAPHGDDDPVGILDRLRNWTSMLAMVSATVTASALITEAGDSSATAFSERMGIFCRKSNAKISRVTLREWRPRSFGATRAVSIPYTVCKKVFLL